MIKFKNFFIKGVEKGCHPGSPSKKIQIKAGYNTVGFFRIVVVWLRPRSVLYQGFGSVFVDIGNGSKNINPGGAGGKC